MKFSRADLSRIIMLLNQGLDEMYGRVPDADIKRYEDLIKRFQDTLSWTDDNGA